MSVIIYAVVTLCTSNVFIKYKLLTVYKYPSKKLAPRHTLAHTTKGALTRSFFLPSTSVLTKTLS